MVNMLVDLTDGARDTRLVASFAQRGQTHRPASTQSFPHPVYARTCQNWFVSLIINVGLKGSCNDVILRLRGLLLVTLVCA